MRFSPFWVFDLIWAFAFEPAHGLPWLPASGGSGSLLKHQYLKAPAKREAGQRMNLDWPNSTDCGPFRPSPAHRSNDEPFNPPAVPTTLRRDWGLPPARLRRIPCKHQQRLPALTSEVFCKPDMISSHRLRSHRCKHTPCKRSVPSRTSFRRACPFSFRMRHRFVPPCASSCYRSTL